MKVILVNPPAENLVRTFAPDSLTEEVGLYPPMGLLYIASYARKMHGARVQIEILDAQVEKMNYKQIRQYLADKKPDVVGISCMTFLLIDALKVAQTAKEVNPQIHVIIGGTHPSIYPEEMLSQSEIDMIVRGEGEYVFSEFLAAFESGKSYAGIKGLGYKENGKNILNPSREFIEDLDRLPFPDRDFLPYKKYYNVLGKGREVMTGLLTSRGCPFNCIFCTPKDGKICRMRSPENVVREIEECYAKGITDFDIIDDTFIINKKRTIAIADLIIKRGLKITMDVRSRVDTVNQEVLDKIAQAGCTRIRFGVESGDPEILKNLRKGITIEQAREAYKMAKKAGLITFAYFMLGSPGETETEIKSSIKLAKELNPDFVQFLITTPFPSTDLYKLGREKGILKGDYWRKFSSHPYEDFQTQWWTEYFSPEELQKWQRKAHLKFYYRPGYLFNQLRQIKSFTELKRKARAAVRMFSK
jgi:radical SAM superfamily enzyme YgiQ (UPF0313 family)